MRPRPPSQGGLSISKEVNIKMRIHRLVATKKGKGFYVKADVSGQGKRSVRVGVGYLNDPETIKANVEKIRGAATLRQALSVSEGV